MSVRRVLGLLTTGLVVAGIYVAVALAGHNDGRVTCLADTKTFVCEEVER